MSKRWSVYDFDESWDIPEGPGVYVIFGDGKLLYIGQSRFVNRRLKNYDINWPRYSSAYIRTPWGDFDRVIVKIRRSAMFGDWAMMELRLIRRLKPPFNCIGSLKKRKAPVYKTIRKKYIHRKGPRMEFRTGGTGAI